MSDATIRYFDCHAVVGPRPMKHPRTRWSVGHLIEDMDLAEIDGALIAHASALHYDACYGNARLKTECSAAPGRLFIVWNIVPLGEPGFFTTGDRLLSAMDEAGIRAVRLTPGHFSLHPDMMGETLHALEEARVLTLIDAGWTDRDMFSFFHPLFGRYPGLPFLLINAVWPHQRFVHRLMALHENLHLEFSSYQINRGLERYVVDFGDERLLFGTGMTEKSPGAARFFIDYAQIPVESKRRIAGGNLTRLLKGQTPVAASENRMDDPLLREARAGIPLSVAVLDAHAHVLHEEGQNAGHNYIMYDGDAQGMIEVNGWTGIDRIAMMSWNGPVCTDAVDGNDIVYRAIRRYPDRVIGVAVIDPTHMTPQEIEAEIKLRYLEQGFAGMKPYPHMNLSYEDERFTDWWVFGDAHGLYALLHVAPQTGGVAAVGRLAERFPAASWIIAHAGGSYAFAEEVAACVRAHPNVYAEITLTPVTNRVIEYLVETAGADRVLFGSDAPMRDPRPQLGWVVWADLPVPIRERILGANFQRILDRNRLKK
ncbi:MAG: amidohydrolase family protein [candidate division Zixibacteria bacterium]|nr:amidohydrolase family protein [candidate division Zixibacteria bacterium]